VKILRLGTSIRFKNKTKGQLHSHHSVKRT